MTLSYDSAKRLLDREGQSHVLRFWDDLNPGQQTSLLAQIADTDFSSVAAMRELLMRAGCAAAAPQDVEPADVVRLDGPAREEARAAGEAALRAGEVGALLVAGGQGSRLGFDGPKGSFPIGPLSRAPLFAIHARKILALERKHSTAIPFYIMTSRENDGATREFFDRYGFFGLAEERVRFFIQGMWPALFPDGRIVMDRPDHLFASPDGHGGILAAMRANGVIDDMSNRGLKTLYYFQVDNPLLEIADPVFIGIHRLRESQISVKVCEKRDPEEGLGVVARREGRSVMVEYTELTHEQKHERLPGGALKFRYGSVAIHVFSLAFLEQEAARQLPLHVAHKKVPFCDERGQTVKPEQPNAYKFEKFIFDVLPHADRTLNLEFRREDEFSPVKNASGQDSPDTARRDMMLKHARWLEACGAAVPRTPSGEPAVRIEIDPCCALGPDDLKGRLSPSFRVKGDLLLE